MPHPVPAPAATTAFCLWHPFPAPALAPGGGGGGPPSLTPVTRKPSQLGSPCPWSCANISAGRGAQNALGSFPRLRSQDRGPLPASGPPPSLPVWCFRDPGAQLPGSHLTLFPPRLRSFATTHPPAGEAANREMPSLPRAGPEGSSRHASSKQVRPDAGPPGKAFRAPMAPVPSVSVSCPCFRNTWRITSTAS